MHNRLGSKTVIASVMLCLSGTLVLNMFIVIINLFRFNLVTVLLNVFGIVNSTALVSWNGSLSRHFCVLNGVKQGGVLSPVFLCLF